MWDVIRCIFHVDRYSFSIENGNIGNISVFGFGRHWFHAVTVVLEEYFFCLVCSFGTIGSSFE